MEWFDARERRGLLFFLPLMLLILVGALVIRTRRMEQEVRRTGSEEHPVAADSLRLFAFDPNTATYDDLLRLGFSTSQAVQLLKYREAGKIYRIPEEVAAIYGMTDSLFRRLRPYIAIGEAYGYPARSGGFRGGRGFAARPGRQFLPPAAPFRVDTASVEQIAALGFSERWATAFLDCCNRYRLRSADELRRFNFIGDSIAALLAPWLIFPEPEPEAPDPYGGRVEINTADSAALVAVYGIGPATAHAILRYRERLGGFCRVEQLAEVKGMRESNYEKIFPQIVCDSFQIQKIDINFAPHERLEVHPYLPAHIIRKLIAKRQQRKSKGGWSTVEELVEEHILTPEEARRLRPYLRFGTQQQYDTHQTPTEHPAAAGIPETAGREPAESGGAAPQQTTEN